MPQAHSSVTPPLAYYGNTLATSANTSEEKPSWSWASVSGAVCFIHNHRPLSASVVEFPPNKPYTLRMKTWVLPVDTIRRHVFGAYFGGYDHFLPWADWEASLETCVDDVHGIAARHRRGEEG
jgi:hypothetical protein